MARLPALILASALLGGCGGEPASDDQPAPIDAAPATIDATTSGTSGCGQAGVATGLQDVTTTVAGVSRHYLVFVPAGYDASTPTRVIFVFHGLGGDGALIRNYFGFEAEADGQAIFVYPDGLPVQGGTGWAASDLPFVDAMFAELSAAYCVDPARVFATGHSYGGYMSNLVGCQRGDLVRAIAPVSGGLLTSACPDPVAAWVAHGNADTTVGESQGIAARDRWITANGCAATSAPTDPAPCVTYDGCADGYPVTWCSFDGGHYPLPDFIQPAIWEFFSRL
jgi:poly(3-hydroxybutyrate) depolymerase